MALSKQTIIAIEGIDRIGKSSFIKNLTDNVRRRKTVLVQKPTIGINTLHKLNYPLSKVSHIMEMRNIGLMEEFLEQCKLRENSNEVIIRDRFNLSELVYGKYLRSNEFSTVFPTHKDPVDLYEQWNEWFETELQKYANVHLICFVLDEQSTPNNDECLDSSVLRELNKQYIQQFSKCSFKNKYLIELSMNKETGLTNIMDYLEWASNLV